MVGKAGGSGAWGCVGEEEQIFSSRWKSSKILISFAAKRKTSRGKAQQSMISS